MNAGKLKTYRASGQEISLQFENLEAKLSVITPKIIRVFVKLDGEERRSKAIEEDKTVTVPVTVEMREDGV